MWIDQRGSEVLQAPECLRLLALAAKRGAIGRIGVSREGAPVIHPVNFAYDDHRVVVRLGEGYMADETRDALVAFEVDQLEGEGEDPDAAWSVLVRGLATRLEGDEVRRALHRLPEPLVAVPGGVLVSIRADDVTGRRFAVSDAVRRAASL